MSYTKVATEQVPKRLHTRQVENRKLRVNGWAGKREGDWWVDGWTCGPMNREVSRGKTG